jgi:predicted heme/steroid binding protein
MNKILQRSSWLIVALLAFVLTGCGSIPTGRYQAFSAAGEDVQSAISDTDIRIEKRLRDFVVLTAPDNLIAAKTFSPSIGGNSFDITSQLKSREAALDVLVKYSKTLESLAGKDLSTDVDKSAQNLAASLNGLPSVGEGSNAGKLLATIADSIAVGVTESKRRDALKSAMTTAQPAVESICKLLQRDYDKITMYVNLMRDRYIDHANANRPKFGTWQRYKFDGEVAADLEEFQQINDALASASAAIQKMPVAHRQLLEGLDSKEPPLDALRDVIHKAQQLRGFYRDLPSN